MHVASTLDLALAFTAEMAVCSASTIAGKGDAISLAVLRLTMLDACLDVLPMATVLLHQSLPHKPGGFGKERANWCLSVTTDVIQRQ